MLAASFITLCKLLSSSVKRKEKQCLSGGCGRKIINNSAPNCSGVNVLGAVSFKLPLNCW